jgi:hypothetical protein
MKIQEFLLFLFNFISKDDKGKCELIENRQQEKRKKERGHAQEETERNKIKVSTT